ncbi:MAG: hypothetical protein JJ900_04690 [Rhodospirillales bacterium]|nr:hypothetical protein [Rhodospirillales bacterium]MBO6786128.1 hypothetical protein [Rhodospirillales bacterium]
MDFFKDPEFIKLTALGIAFVVGVIVCIYVAIRETAELKRRRQAKKLMYEDAVRRELKRKQQMMQKVRDQEALAEVERHLEAQDRQQSGESFA